MEPVTFTPFELGQLLAVLGNTGLRKLSPELRLKLELEVDRITQLEAASHPVRILTPWPFVVEADDQ